jgi:putative endopeptidase
MLNEIVFPAAILQPPFFFAPTAEKPLGEPVLNFGAIGYFN